MFKKPTPVTVRSLAEADPTYAATAETVQRLKAAARKLDAEEARLHDTISRRPQEAAQSSRVSALLGDPVADEASDDARGRLKAIAGERIDIRAALDVATQRLTTARFGASRTICAEVEPMYRTRVQALAGALLAAHSAHVELLALISELNANDVAWSGLVPMQAEIIFGHDHGKLEGWLRQAKDAGYIDDVEVAK